VNASGDYARFLESKVAHSLGWAMLGCVDYAAEMRMICRGVTGGWIR
jgi:hypothetical protein